MKTNAYIVLRHTILCIITDISRNRQANEHEYVDDEVVVSSTLHPLISNPWLLIFADKAVRAELMLLAVAALMT